MEIQIHDLVTSIKKEGIVAAEAEAGEIIAKANSRAAEIIANAENKAKQIKADTEKEIEVIKQSARVDAEHAERDAVLAFKNAVKSEYEKILSADVNKTVNGAVLANLIKAALNGENPADYSAEVAEISDELQGELAAQIKNGLELKISKYVNSGFKLAAKDGSGYFDCSDEEISDMLKPFLPELNI